jgi:hypothetical protein
VDDETVEDETVAESGDVESEVVTDDPAAPVAPAPRPNGEAVPGFRRASTEGTPTGGNGSRAFPRHAVASAPAASAMPGTSASVVDEPLLSDVAGFRTRWQQTQAGFVDDPRQAVGEAADLIEQAAQALVVAVRQRQRQLRESWDRTPEAHGTEPANVADTEQLRLMMQRYRALFNQLCRP